MKQSFQQYIRIVGARKNNLKNVSLDISKKVITVFTGVLGSGKSSLVFDTIAAESQRQLNETFTTFIHNRLPHYGQPEADRLENLSPVIVVDQNAWAVIRARQSVLLPISIRCYACCFHALANRRQVNQRRIHSTTRAVCVRNVVAPERHRLST